jgi:hypothetical protein
VSKFEEISIFSNGGHLGWRALLSDIILKGTEPGTIKIMIGINRLKEKFHTETPNIC